MNYKQTVGQAVLFNIGMETNLKERKTLNSIQFYIA